VKDQRGLLGPGHHHLGGVPGFDAIARHAGAVLDEEVGPDSTGRPSPRIVSPSS
jgi:hypothetical protein